MYSQCEPSARREIILSAKINKAHDWLRELKESFLSMEHWQRMAYIYSTKSLPYEERKFFLDYKQPTNALEISLSKWSRNKI